MNIRGYPTLKLLLPNKKIVEYNMDNKKLDLKYFIEKNVFNRLLHYSVIEEYN